MSKRTRAVGRVERVGAERRFVVGAVAQRRARLGGDGLERLHRLAFAVRAHQLRLRASLAHHCVHAETRVAFQYRVEKHAFCALTSDGDDDACNDADNDQHNCADREA